MTNSAYSNGYTQALADMAQKFRDGGEQEARDWIKNNLPRGYYAGDRVCVTRYDISADGFREVHTDIVTILKVNRTTANVETQDGRVTRVQLADIFAYADD